MLHQGARIGSHEKRSGLLDISGLTNDIGAEDARVRLFVIPTNEELLIARDAVRIILDAPRRW